MGTDPGVQRHIARLFKFAIEAQQVNHRQRLVERITPRRHITGRQFDPLEQGFDRQIEYDITDNLSLLALLQPIGLEGTEMTGQHRLAPGQQGKARVVG